MMLPRKTIKQKVLVEPVSGELKLTRGFIMPAWDIKLFSLEAVSPLLSVSAILPPAFVLSAALISGEGTYR